MREFWNIIQVAIAAAGGWLGYFLGGCDGLIYALAIFVAADYRTGVMCAVVNKRLSSEIGFKGICKKLLIFILVGIAHILDERIIGDGSIIRTAAVFFYISNEGISVLENAAALGLPIPEKLASVLRQLKEEDDGNEDN